MFYVLGKKNSQLVLKTPFTHSACPAAGHTLMSATPGVGPGRDFQPLTAQTTPQLSPGAYVTSAYLTQKCSLLYFDLFLGIIN